MLKLKLSKEGSVGSRYLQSIAIAWIGFSICWIFKMQSVVDAQRGRIAHLSFYPTVVNTF
ncbi:MAG: hypothetical protein WBL88_08095 [Nitrososphaeraceae archaeon]